MSMEKQTNKQKKQQQKTQQTPQVDLFKCVEKLHRKCVVCTFAVYMLTLTFNIFLCLSTMHLNIHFSNLLKVTGFEYNFQP